MKKTRKASLLILTGILIPALSFAYGKHESRASIDWSAGKIIARGVSTIRTSPEGRPWCEEDKRYISLNEGRLRASDRAHDIAMEKLVAVLKTLSLDSRETLEAMLSRSEFTRKKLSHQLKEKSKQKIIPAGYFESACILEISIRDIITTLPFNFPNEEFPLRIDNTIETEYSSLIIDTRGLKIGPMLFPAIVNSRGKEVFSRLHVNIKNAGPSGMVTYVFTEQKAMNHRRAGIHPYYAVALKKVNESPVLSERDISKIYSSQKKMQQLKDCRVIFIIDRK